jgi:hypothetical protein
MRTARAFAPVLVVLIALIASMALLAACGGDDDDDDASPAATTAPESGAGQNACPVDGCSVTITDVQNEGDELRVTWETNYTPDFSKNHVHVYWDTFTADQVSDDAAERGVEQGEWVPTGDHPDFITEGAVSTSARGDSTTICVTAGDRDHNVIDSSLVDCRDVADLL